MGQYYHTIVRDPKTGKDTYYDQQTTLLKRDRKGNITDYDNYNGLKLMEHSWWANNFCRSLAATLVDNPQKVCWVGDYAEPDEGKALGFDTDAVWNHDLTKTIAINKRFSMDSVKYLVNNDKKVYVDLADYKKKSDTDGWVVFPVALLTALGNGRGGGDFHGGTGEDQVGAWAFDEIYLTNDLPEGYDRLELAFVEK